MKDQVMPENLSTLERVCDPVSVTVTDSSSSGDYHATRSVTVTLGACGIDEIVSVIRAAAFEAGNGRVGR